MQKFPFAIPDNALSTIPASIPLWPEERPASGQPEADWYREDRPQEGRLDRFVANFSYPELFPYPAAPADNTGLAVLVCPGGAYVGQAIDKEGHDLARFFNSFGVSAFVLKYRVPVVNDVRRCEGVFTGALADALRAIRFIRANAEQYGIRKVGVMGFSAGGHLAATASTLYNDPLEPNPAMAVISARPDFSILVYPVITFTDEERCHKGSRKNLLGLQATLEELRHYSPELQVTPETPPCILLQTADDSVHVGNSILYFMACRAQGVAAEMHLFPEGGHGYGLAQRGLAVDTWPQRLQEWILRQK